MARELALFQVGDPVEREKLCAKSIPPVALKWMSTEAGALTLWVALSIMGCLWTVAVLHWFLRRFCRRGPRPPRFQHPSELYDTDPIEHEVFEYSIDPLKLE